ncbi:MULTISPECIES: ATP-dependent endonuclease [Microbacterium]|uniref:ATP-dependent nuclease n=1 Tax=Microbacterium TaxID=33882 RepID=UPI0027813E48|nr:MULTISPECIES: AAA family ATPase [Microbacterium]MDQ1077277.1 putative ATP-dependent endonuclease of OLD family [Microbacterium sp. SORGH_AS_0969]MDQ1117521.1 putative ATP-dependent endonuclease of OLD family [Microbacterium testaceum]
MHIDRVDVERFLGFEHLSIEVDPQLQLIAGPNNAGKSSLLRILETFFSDPGKDDLQRLKPLHEYYVHGGPRMMSSIQVQFTGLDENEAEYFADAVTKGVFAIKILCSRAGNITYQTSRKSTRAREFYERVLESFSFVKIPSVRVSEADQSERDQSLVRLYETLEGVLVRSGGSRRTQLQKDFEDVIAPVETLVHKVLSESVEAVASELPFRERELGIKLPDSRHALRGMLQQAVITSRDEIEVSIAERGTGFQSAMVLGILRYVASRSKQSSGKVVFVIEEPEAFLHPQTQRAMAKILRDISKDAQLLVTTHSPVLVDSFSVSRIVRMPLSPSGMTYSAKRRDFSAADEGRLTRYCDATNSELVFANAVVIVEGYGDKLVIDYLLERITGCSGGHYAMGIAVIEASSIDTIPHLLHLAQIFGVRAYVVTDKDGVHKAGGNGKRKLLEMLKAKERRPTQDELRTIHQLADENVTSLTAALTQQHELNTALQPWDAFVLSSDLEGLLLDTIGQQGLAAMLGPIGEKQIDKAMSERFATGAQGKEDLASWMGSKGWNSTRKVSAKAKPHLPVVLLREHLSSRSSVPRALRPLDDWLRGIVSEQERSPL